MELNEILEIAKEVGELADKKGHDSILEWAINVYETAANRIEKPKKPWEK